MALLIGRHINKIDRKGRVSVPKLFRDALKDQSFIGLYAFPQFKYPAIEACGEDFMTRISQSLEDLDLFSDEQDEMAAVIMENAHPLAFDPEGRVVLPPELLQHAGITTEALFVGRGIRFQIWAPETYDMHARQTVEKARSRGATLKLRPSGPTDRVG